MYSDLSKECHHANEQRTLIYSTGYSDFCLGDDEQQIVRANITVELIQSFSIPLILH